MFDFFQVEHVNSFCIESERNFIQKDQGGKQIFFKERVLLGLVILIKGFHA